MIHGMLNIYVAISMVKPRKLFLELHSSCYANKEIISYYTIRKKPKLVFFQADNFIYLTKGYSDVARSNIFQLASCFKNSLYVIPCVCYDGNKARLALASLKCPLHGTAACSFMGYCKKPSNKLIFAIDIRTHAHPHQLIGTERWVFHKSKILKKLCFSKLPLLNTGLKEYILLHEYYY